MKTVSLFLLTLLLCRAGDGQHLLPIHDHGEGRSRLYHPVHYLIDIRLDEVRETVTGITTVTLTPYIDSLTEVVLDAEGMTFGKIRAGKDSLAWSADSSTVTVKLSKPLMMKDTVKISLEYSCKPKEGMTFIKADSAYPERRWQIWSQGESTTNHFWFPCYDFPNEKSTSEVIVTVNAKFSALSNGKLIDVRENRKEGTRTFHWKESKPHPSYLVMVAAGEYTILHDKAGKLPLEYWVYPDDTLNARIAFHETPAMIRFFNEKIGFDYPWEKYGQILCQDHFGGMENTSATTLADGWAVTDRRARIDDLPTSLIAHELAHQWWGDAVTCRDWRHLWLNESFASYFDPLYEEFSLGRDEFDYTMSENQQAGINSDTSRGRKPVVSEDSYGTNIYPRGAAILHMLRFVLGDQLFWKSIHQYITDNQFKSAETNDLKNAIEKATGQNLYWFFDEWLYKAGHPVFDVSYRWNDSSRSISLSVRQTQTVDSLTPVFRTPVDVEVTTPEGSVTHRLNILTRDTVFTLNASSRPLMVVFDKGNWLLKEISFSKPDEEWRYQALHAGHNIARLNALRGIARAKENGKFVQVFTEAMTSDPFWANRREAVNLSEKLHADGEEDRAALKTALLRASADVKSAVRAAAVARLGSFTGSDVRTAVTAALEDSSYAVMQSALRSLAKIDSAASLPVLKRYLSYPSLRDRIAGTALSTIGSADSTEAFTLALGYAKYGQPIAMRQAALGILRKYGKNRPETLPLLHSMVRDNVRQLRFWVFFTLGAIGNESTIPVLEQIAGDKDDPLHESADNAVKQIKKRLEEKQAVPKTEKK